MWSQKNDKQKKDEVNFLKYKLQFLYQKKNDGKACQVKS
jgi:hypothetical protein